jgi:hypothetical protein
MKQFILEPFNIYIYIFFFFACWIISSSSRDFTQYILVILWLKEGRWLQQLIRLFLEEFLSSFVHSSDEKYILSRIYGSVSNNNVLWVRRLDLLTHFTLVNSITIIQNQSSAEPISFECRGLAPFSFSSYDCLLIYHWTTYIVPKRLHRKHLRWPAMDICEPHKKHLFLCWWIYRTLHSMGSYPTVACVSAD